MTKLFSQLPKSVQADNWLGDATEKVRTPSTRAAADKAALEYLASLGKSPEQLFPNDQKKQEAFRAYLASKDK